MLVIQCIGEIRADDKNGSQRKKKEAGLSKVTLLNKTHLAESCVCKQNVEKSESKVN